MKKQAYHVFLAATFLLIVFVPLALFWRDPETLDLFKDEEPFKSMVLPPKSVHASLWMDGGSVSVEVIDHNGVHHEITFPIAGRGTRKSYPTAYVGPFNNPKMIPLKDPARAKEIIIRLLRDYGRKDDEYLQGALICLSGQPPDFATRMILITKELFERGFSKTGHF